MQLYTKKNYNNITEKRWKVYILLQAKDENCFSFSKPKEARQLKKQVEISHAITIIISIHYLFDAKRCVKNTDFKCECVSRASVWNSIR